MQPFKSRRHLAFALAALMAAGGALGQQPAASASAATYPDRPVKLIVPYAAGGIADTVARLVGTKLSERLRQPMVVENRPGSSAIVGNDFVARAPADGYTLLLGTTTLIQAPALQTRLPYDALKDFAPVAQVMAANSLLLVPASSPVTSLDALVKQAKRETGKHNYGHYGSGTSSHLFGELLKIDGGSLDLVAIPFKGASPLINEMLPGRIEAAFLDVGSAQSYVTAGQLRPLAVTGKQRAGLFPNVPTMGELGYTGFDLSSWIGVFAPAQTPRPVIAKLSAEINAIMRTPEIKDRLAALGVETVTGTPDDLAAMMKSDAPRWAKLIQSAGIKPE